MATEKDALRWDHVDRELDRVPADFKDPKFYALKHVVEILSAQDPQGLVGQVRHHLPCPTSSQAVLGIASILQMAG